MTPRWTRDPMTLAARKQMAAFYRKVRRTHPAMARLLWRRMNGAERELIRRMWGL